MFITEKRRSSAMRIALILAIIGPVRVHAQPDGHGDIRNAESMTAEQLAEWVLEANPGLASAAAGAAAAAYRVEPAGSLDDPVVSYGNAPFTAGSGRLNQRIEFSQEIPWPGTLRAREAAAQYEAEAVGNDVDALRLRVVAQAKSAHAEWRFVDEALGVHDETQDLLDELISTAQTRYAAGTALRQDVLQAEVERADLDNHKFLLRRQQTTVQARINALLNRSADSLLPDADPITIHQSLPAGEVLEERALGRHPELAGLEARVSANQSRVALARQDFYPDFRVGVGYNSLWDDPDKRTIVGVSINIPLDRGKRKAELSRAQAQRRQAEWTLIDRRSALLADVAQTRAEVIEAQESVRLFESKLVPLAEEYLSAAMADYESGAGAFLNVVTAERRVLDTGLALARARADYVRRLAELERVTGGDLFTPQQVHGGLQR